MTPEIFACVASVGRFKVLCDHETQCEAQTLRVHEKGCCVKYDPRISKELHPRCGVTRKRIFKSCEAALMVAGELPTDDGRIKPNRAGRCQYCGGWHLTSHPAFSGAGQI
jgi:hypothetical protein